jgi:parvulin-like peptidyl-prolyl isomerase
VPEGLVIFRLLSVEPARLPPLEEARADVLRAVRRQKALDEAKGRAATLLEAARKGEDPRALARQGGVTYAEIGPFSRAEPLADRALGQAVGPVTLALAEGGVGGPVEGPGGFYVIKLLKRDRPDPPAFEPARAALEARLLREKRARLWQGWLSAARAGAKIEVKRHLLSDG